MSATTTASADFSLRVSTSPFQAQGEISPGKNTLLHRTTAGFTPPPLGHKSFAAYCPLALLSSAFYPVLVHRLTVYDPHFLPTVSHPSAVVLHFVRCGQLTGGLTPPGVRPCRAHRKSAHWHERHRGRGQATRTVQSVFRPGAGSRLISRRRVLIPTAIALVRFRSRLSAHSTAAIEVTCSSESTLTTAAGSVKSIATHRRAPD